MISTPRTHSDKRAAKLRGLHVGRKLQIAVRFTPETFAAIRRHSEGSDITFAEAVRRLTDLGIAAAKR
ncbi:MAG: hypothetical protein GY952_06650 [Rhodobacteraceae bacterium]|nr:hypothetical protein [Paracoccaceae bacterium]